MNRRFSPYLYIAPCVVLIALFTYWPIIYSFWLSFQHFEPLSGRTRFVGLDNYGDLLTSNDFQNSLRVTFLLTIGTVPIRLALALALAHVLRGESSPVRAMRCAYFLPYVTSSVAVAVVWSWIFNTDMGFANALLQGIGLPRLAWFQNTDLALLAIGIVAVWKQLGYDALLYVAGLNAIPDDFYEAARLDGASRWRQFKELTWPLVAPTTLFLLVVSVIDSFQIFTLVNIMTRGGPAGGTDVLMNHLYYLSFILFDLSKGSTLAVVLFLLLTVITVTKLAIARRRVTYDLA